LYSYRIGGVWRYSRRVKTVNGYDSWMTVEITFNWLIAGEWAMLTQIEKLLFF